MIDSVQAPVYDILKTKRSVQSLATELCRKYFLKISSPNEQIDPEELEDSMEMFTELVTKALPQMEDDDTDIVYNFDPAVVKLERDIVNHLARKAFSSKHLD